jgi:type 1 fimbria pilin
MKLITALSSVFLLLPLTSFAASEGQSGVIHITGQVVNSGCAVGQVGGLVSRESRQVELGSGLTVDVDTFHNACSRQSLPFSMTYEALETSTDNGVVTITYL